MASSPDCRSTQSSAGVAFVPAFATKSSTGPSTLDVTIGAGIGYFFSDKLVYDVPVLVGARLGDRHEIIVGARVSHQLWFGVTDSGRPLNYVMLGGSAASRR